MNDNGSNKLACSFCGKPMEQGFIWLSSGNASLRWQHNEPDLSSLKFWSMEQGDEILRANLLLFPKTLRKAYRCVECDCLTIANVSKNLV